MINDGKLLFKYRGQFPLLLLIGSTIIMYNSDCYQGPESTKNTIQIFAIIIALLGIIIRCFTIGSTPGTSGRNRNKQVAKQLNTSGAYSIVRNPLYLANYIIWLKYCNIFIKHNACCSDITIVFIYYERIIFTEEDYLLKKFKTQYIDFCQKVPVFIPCFNNYQKSQHPFSFKKILRQEYSTIISTIIVFLFFEGTINYFCNSTIYLKPIYVKILLLSIGLTLCLKIIKSYTKILDNK